MAHQNSNDIAKSFLNTLIEPNPDIPVAYENVLFTAQLNYSIGSLQRVDRLLHQLKNYSQQDFGDYKTDSKKSNFLQVLSFYVGEMAAKYTKSNIYWFSPEQFTAVFPDALPLAGTLTNRYVAVIGGQLFKPMEFILRSMFHKQEANLSQYLQSHLNQKDAVILQPKKPLEVLFPEPVVEKVQPPEAPDHSDSKEQAEKSSPNSSAPSSSAPSSRASKSSAPEPSTAADTTTSNAHAKATTAHTHTPKNSVPPDESPATAAYEQAITQDDLDTVPDDTHVTQSAPVSTLNAVDEHTALPTTPKAQPNIQNNSQAMPSQSVDSKSLNSNNSDSKSLDSNSVDLEKTDAPLAASAASPLTASETASAKSVAHDTADHDADALHEDSPTAAPDNAQRDMTQPDEAPPMPAILEEKSELIARFKPPVLKPILLGLPLLAWGGYCIYSMISTQTFGTASIIITALCALGVIALTVYYALSNISVFNNKIAINTPTQNVSAAFDQSASFYHIPKGTGMFGSKAHVNIRTSTDTLKVIAQNYDALETLLLDIEAELLVAPTLKRIDYGETVYFGQLQLTHELLIYGKKALPIDRIGDYDLDETNFIVLDTDGAVFAKIALSNQPNINTFVTVVEHLQNN